MRFLYTISIYAFKWGMRVFSLFNEKAKKGIRGRKNPLPQLTFEEEKSKYWFHCASLGEFDQGLPLMRKIKAEDPNALIITTFFSPSGMDHYHKRNHVSDIVCYLPFDTPSAAKNFIAHFRPNRAFFVKYEFWLNYIFELDKKDIPTYNISGNFRENQRFFKWYGGIFRKALATFEALFVQNESSKKLLNSIGIKQVYISGDSRFDRVIENKNNTTPNSIIEQFLESNTEDVFVIGSSWPIDEKLLIEQINSSTDKIIIAPHNVDEVHVKGITSQLKRPFSLYTEGINDNSEILIINTIGQLASAYKYGTYAYVGGGFTGSLHNILEPAVFGLPVIYGPKHSKFPEGQNFINGGFGFEIETGSDLKTVIQKIKSNLETIKNAELDFVSKNAGATDFIFQQVIAN